MKQILIVPLLASFLSSLPAFFLGWLAYFLSLLPGAHPHTLWRKYGREKKKRTTIGKPHVIICTLVPLLGFSTSWSMNHFL